MVLRINVLQCNKISIQTVITFIVRKNWTHTSSASGSYGRLAGRQNMDELQIFNNSKNSLQVELFGFLLHLITSNAILIIVLEIHFNQLISSKAYFKACLTCKKSVAVFVPCQSLLLGTNDNSSKQLNCCVLGTLPGISQLLGGQCCCLYNIILCYQLFQCMVINYTDMYYILGQALLKVPCLKFTVIHQ